MFAIGYLFFHSMLDVERSSFKITLKKIILTAPQNWIAKLFGQQTVNGGREYQVSAVLSRITMGKGEFVLLAIAFLQPTSTKCNTSIRVPFTFGIVLDEVFYFRFLDGCQVTKLQTTPHLFYIVVFFYFYIIYCYRRNST